MDEMVSPHAASETADYLRVVDEYIVNIQHLLDKMRQDQTEIERLATESRAIQSDTDRLIAETRAALARVQAAPPA